MKIIVIGAGAWGTALAVSAAGHNQITLLVRDAAQAAAVQAGRINTRYLPGISLPAAVQVRYEAVDGVPALAAQHDLIIIATPLAGLREWLTRLADTPKPVAWLCKGFEADTGQGLEQKGLLAHEICAQVAPKLIAGILSGPSFAMEVARAQPTALVAASDHALARQLLVDAFHSPSLRVYANDDLVGVEVGGAVKNVLAIATGLCDGLQLPGNVAAGLGLNARAALITRGLAEMTRLGVALGAKLETFMGLSGLGDLVLTATGDLSRNRQVGLLLAQGHTLAQATASLGHVAEGVLCARSVVQRAQALGVDMPIAQCVVDLLDGKLAPAQAVDRLMGRLPASE